MLAGALAALALECSTARHTGSGNAISLVVDWNYMLLDAEVNTEGYRGPIAARAYAYIGLAAYETGRPGFDGELRSVAQQYSGLILPSAPPDALYDMEIALNACYTTMVRHFFLSAPETVRAKQKQLETKWIEIIQRGKTQEVVRASTTFGKQVADAVYTWSASDTFGFEANHHNYDRTFVPPVGDGKWVPSADFPMPALLPYWGRIRPFIIDVDQFIADTLPPFSTVTNGLYHQQAVELISLSKPLSSENQWIAEFWHDDRPGLTFSPPGHWLAIVTQVIDTEQPSIDKALCVYLKVGFALADAMIACWKAKYIHNVMRPETYIQQHIDPNWRPYAPSPSSPSYPSGHSMMGAAAAEILVAEFGSPYEMVDHSHSRLRDYKMEPRQFNSFDEMARENALSRLFLGVHWRFDCEEGLRLGTLIGKQVAAINLQNQVSQ
jgi:hypothetical protein